MTSACDDADYGGTRAVYSAGWDSSRLAKRRGPALAKSAIHWVHGVMLHTAEILNLE